MSVTDVICQQIWPLPNIEYRKGSDKKKKKARGWCGYCPIIIIRWNAQITMILILAHIYIYDHSKTFYLIGKSKSLLPTRKKRAKVFSFHKSLFKLICLWKICGLIYTGRWPCLFIYNVFYWKCVIFFPNKLTAALLSEQVNLNGMQLLLHKSPQISSFSQLLPTSSFLSIDI